MTWHVAIRRCLLLFPVVVLMGCSGSSIAPPPAQQPKINTPPGNKDTPKASMN